MVTVPKKNTSQVKQPVTITQKPWVRCTVCERQVFYMPGEGAAQAALNEHYNSQHLDVLISA